MIQKIVYVCVNAISIFVLCIAIRRTRKLKLPYGRELNGLLIAAACAVLSYIVVALSVTSTMALIAFGFYFASIDWVSFFLFGFCFAYTKHDKFLKKIRIPIMVMFLLDTLSIFINLVILHMMQANPVYDAKGALFFIYSAPALPYYIHLAIDYLTILAGFIALIVGMLKSYSFYRVKYVIIVGIVTAIIVLNLIYMEFALTLDWSVIFYAVAGVMIYFFSIYYSPNSLITKTIRRAVDEMNEGLIFFDEDNECIFINEFVKHYFGIKNISECTTELLPIKTILDGDEGIGSITENRHKQCVLKGETKEQNEYFKVHFNLMKDSKGHRLGGFFRIENITDEYKGMIALEEARIEANRANEAKSNFLASMSHEIRTPINAVLGMNEMVLRECDDKQIREYSLNIQSAGNSLLGLINDILDFSKIEAGKMELVLDTYNPHKMLRDVYHMLEARAVSKGLALNIICDDNLPSGLYGDENRVRQILANLTTNGIKYTQKGSVTIRVGFSRTDDKKIDLRLDVEDTGIGISKENQEKLFNAFQRVDVKRNRNIEGTGLGLAITQQLVGLMDGEIMVRSVPGEGSVFSAVISQTITNETPVGHFVKTVDETKTEYKESFRAPGAEILVVDDVPMNLKVVQALLKKTEIHIDTAGGGIRAYDMCKEKKYDIILMDHMMPTPDGIETLRMIKQEGMNKETCVIVLTANAINGADREYMAAGFADYLTKPVVGETLEKMLIKYLPKEKIE